MKRILFLTVGLLMFVLSGMAQNTIPAPTVYLNFNSDWFVNDNVVSDFATKVPLSSGRAQDPVWYNYNGNFPSLYGGYRTGDTLKFGGAAFFSGYKSVCDDDPDFPGDNSPAASRDALFFAGNNNVNNWDVIDTSSLWQGVRKSFTLAYWWRSERPLTGNLINACPADNEIPDWGEEETQFDGGSFNGIDINCWYNYYKIGWRNGSDGVDESHASDYFVPSKEDGSPDNAPAPGEWVHVAVTFDGSTGLLTLYLNGTVAVDFEGKTTNPNPIQTGYSQFDAVTFDPEIVGTPYGSVLFGATNGPSPSGKNSGGAFWGEVPEYEGKFGYVEDHYRLGWPARGFLDEFAYWKDTVLTQEQIRTIMNNEIEGLIPTGIHHSGIKEGEIIFSVYPNPSAGDFMVEIRGDNPVGGKIEVFNAIGAKVVEKEIMPGEKQVRFNEDLVPGLYFVRTSLDGKSTAERLIIKR